MSNYFTDIKCKFVMFFKVQNVKECLECLENQGNSKYTKMVKISIWVVRTKSWGGEDADVILSLNYSVKYVCFFAWTSCLPSPQIIFKTLQIIIINFWATGILNIERKAQVWLFRA